MTGVFQVFGSKEQVINFVIVELLLWFCGVIAGQLLLCWYLSVLC
jgi:hypothetical protein